MQRSGEPTPRSARLVVDLHFYLRRIPGDTYHYYPQDEDSARGSFKAGQDALQDAGWVKTDSAKNVRAGTTTLYTTAKTHGGKTGLVAVFTEIIQAGAVPVPAEPVQYLIINDGGIRK